MERFNFVVAQLYPDATPETIFVANSFQQLNQLGFGQNNTIACMGTCRDISTHALYDQLAETWGDFSTVEMNGCQFSANALEQFLDVQETTARPHLLFIGLTQIGIDTDTGWYALNQLQRECMFAQAKWRNRLNLQDDLTTLRRQLAPYLIESNPSLVELTFHAHNAMCDDLQRWIDKHLVSAEINYAVLSGIQLFGNTDEQLIWPGVGYAVVNGQRHVLELDTEYA